MSELLTMCQMTNNFEGTKKCLEILLPYIDRAVIITGELSNKEIESLKAMGPNIYIFWHVWEDNFSKQRNHYLDELRGLGPPYGWAIVCDHDEWLSEKACKLLREYVDKSNGGLNYSVVKINSHDITYDWNGNKVFDQKSNWYKDLLFKVWATTHYIGNPHEGLRTLVTDIRVMPDDAPYYHVKTYQHILRRGVENFWVGGGGDNMGSTNPTWVELKEICDGLELKKFKDFHEYLKGGHIDLSLADWIIKYRDTDERPWADSELRAYFVYYYHFLHPEERPNGLDTKFKYYAPSEEIGGIVSKSKAMGKIELIPR